MPNLHKYVPSSKKDGFYIYASHNGQNVTYQVTDLARRIFERLGYGDNDSISGEIFYALHRFNLIYTNRSGVEPPTSLRGITDEIEVPNDATDRRKHFFEILREEGNFDREEREDLDQYVERHKLNGSEGQEDTEEAVAEAWRPRPPKSADVYRGTVDFFNDTGGYGFIECDSFKDDTFYHMEDLGGRDIQEGTELEFVRIDTEDGPRATHVREVPPNKSPPKTSPNNSASETQKGSEAPLEDRPPLETFQEARLYDLDLKVTFLGSGARWPTEDRMPNSVFVKRGSHSFLFDVGEGTQRQMHKYGTGFALDEIFLTSTEVDRIGGLGPLLNTLSVQGRDEPIDVYVPAAGAEKVNCVLALHGEYGYPINVEGVESGVIYESEDYSISAVRTDSTSTKIGYVLEEVPRRGRFNRAKAEELGVTPGPDFTRLCRGETVTTEAGTEVDPRTVLGDPTPGRKITYAGSVTATEKLVTAAQDSDLLIHEASYPSKDPDTSGELHRATGKIAGTVANQSGPRRLVLTSIAPSAEHKTDRVLKRARDRFSGEVQLVSDGDSVEIPVPESTTPAEATASPEQSTMELGNPVTSSNLKNGMYIQLTVDRAKGPDSGSNKGLSKNGSVHIWNGGDYVGEQVVVRVVSVNQGYAVAEIAEPQPDTVVYPYKGHQSKHKKKSSKRKSKYTSEKSQVSSLSSNPFKGSNQTMKDLVRKKH